MRAHCNRHLLQVFYGETAACVHASQLREKGTLINSLVMGFGILGRRLELLLVPVVLSIIVLLLPPVDLSILARQLESSLEQMQQLPRETGPTTGTASPRSEDTDIDPGLEAQILGMDAFPNDGLPWSLGEAMENFSLGIILVNRMFFRVPGYVNLAPMTETGSAGAALAVSSVQDLLLLFGSAFACSILAGALYLYQLGQLVRHHFQRFETLSSPGEEPGLDTDAPVQAAAGFWFRTGQMFLYFAFLLAVWMGSVLLVALILGIFSLAAPGAAVGLMYFVLMSFLIAYPLFIYYQTYVVAGVMMDGFTAWQAFRNSLQLVRLNFLPTLLFLLLAGFILWGIELLLVRLVSLTGDHTAGVLIASLLFAYVGTGVALAFLVFYRTRLLAQQGVDITPYFETQES